MNVYLMLRAIHISCAALSFLGFAARGLLMIVESPWLQQKWIKILPHFVDTLLLATAIALVVISRQYPIVVPWVTVKIALLVVYILLGTLALKRGRTKKVRITALLLALTTILSIFVVAILKPPFWG